jgi:uncharacterized repeat protein (TIGR01451 family)
VTFTFTVTNTTPVGATDVTVTDTLPAGLTFLSSPDGCTSDDGVTITCAVDELAASGSVTLTVVVEAADPFPADDVTDDGLVPNAASVAAPGTNCPPDATDPAEVCGSTVEVPLQPQLSIDKATTADQIVPGGQVTFELTVLNPSAAAATGVVVTDVLPVGLTFVSSPEGCTSDDGVTVTCAVGAMAAGAEVVLTVIVEVADPFPGDDVTEDGAVPNTASVTAPGTNCPPDATDPAEACESTVEVPLQPQLSIAKTTTTAQIVPGGDVEFTVTVTNPSPAPATDVTVTDSLPAGLTLVSVDNDACTSDDDVTITCALGEIPAGGSVTIVVVAEAADPFPGDDVTAEGGVPNTATVTSPDTNCPPDATDPAEACESTVVVALQPLLSIDKSTTATQIVPGAQIPFEITVTNDSAASATGVSVTDVLPAGLTFVSSPDDCTSPDTVTVTCAVSVVPAGSSVTFTVIAQAADPFPADDVTADGDVANTASVTSPDTNCPPGAAEPAPECSSSVEVPVQPQVTIDKAATSPLIVPGETLAFTFTVTNTGVAPATDVTVTDTLPAGLRFVSADDLRCSSPDAVTVNCDLGDLAAGESVVIEVVTVASDPFPPDDVSEAGTVANTASVASPESNCPPDAAEPAEECGSTVVVSVEPQLLIEKSTTAGQVVPGSEVPYSFTVTNSTPTVARDVTVTDELPAGLTFVSADDDRCSSADSVTITCELGDLAADASVTVNVVTQAADPFPPDDVTDEGVVQNTASVTAPGTNCPPGATDPAPACSSTADLPLEPWLTIEKTTSATQVVPGEQVSYEITVANETPTTATDVTVTDTLPPGLTFVSSDNPACDSFDGVTITCVFGSVGAGSPVTVSIVVQAADPFPAEGVDDGAVANTATVTSPGSSCPPEAPGPPVCSSTVVVPLQPRVSIEKSTTATRIDPGGSVPYAIVVTNTGPVTARDVMVTDELPAGLTVVSADHDGCAAADDVTITCDLGDLASGDAVVVNVVTAAADPFPADAVVDGVVANTATVTSPGSNCDVAMLGGMGSGPALRTVSVSRAGRLLQAGEVCESTVELPVRPTVTIDKTAGVDRIVPGSDVPYRIEVTNPGPVTATDVVVVDGMPEGFVFVSSSHPGCAATGGRTVTCTVGDLEGGATVAIDLVVRAPDPLPAGALDPSGGVANTATVTSPGSNCDLADEVCSSTVVVPPADAPVPPPGPTEPPGPSPVPPGPPGPTPPFDGGGDPDGGWLGDAGPFGRMPRTGLAIAALLLLALAAIGTGLGLRRSGRSLRQRLGRSDT